MSYILPPELLCHVFSFLQYHDLYLTRGVSKLWCSMVEQHIYLSVKTQQQSVSIMIGQSPFISTLELNADTYDPLEKVVTFKPKHGYTVASPMETATCPSSWQLYHHRQMQIKLNPPHSNSTDNLILSSSWLRALSPQEQEQALFHLQYNPVMECSYALPAYSWLTSSMFEQADQHYVGDKTLILSFSYIQSPFENSGNSVETSDYLPSTLPTPPSPSPSPSQSHCAPQIKIHWLRVTLDWIISFTQPKIKCTQIYANRYTQLHQILANQYGCYKYDNHSEPVLGYIVHQDKNDKHQQSPSSPSARMTIVSTGSSTPWITIQADDDDSLSSTSSMMTTAPPAIPSNDISDLTLPKELLSYVQEHTHEYQTRLSRLEHMLEGACVNPRMLWKYPFAKSFVVGNGSLLSEEAVVRRIQDSEDEWRLLSQTLKRRLGSLL